MAFSFATLQPTLSLQHKVLRLRALWIEAGILNCFDHNVSLTISL